ncbi:ABC transporter substrate-binding protein [Maritalea porphyrae]|uniref:ABC transporter substrate-binding protein n=1 Tax=Maritalea porphyrae TaxID=880732 RepID=UPI0022AE81DC|nr:ABC transporter substrate-binding protein [Maritalea porphyrae]MCZ4273409.1 ABC transporter substrate-binding protein [Maritalea porphyrae]
MRILTSMSERVFAPYVQRFEALNPHTKVLVLNKNTNHALGEISLGNKRGFDLFWASSPEAFDMLETFDHLAPIEGETHHAFALSSLGWSWRKGNMDVPPQSWNDLLDEKYEGRIGIARPSRSGTTHLLLEQFLQDRGWEEGWEYLLALSSNFATITSRSFGVIDGLKSGRFDIGLSIDFLAISEPDIAFRYGRPVMLVPARIAKLRNGAAPALADEFVAFVLSREGQQILLSPDLNRIPIDKELRQTLSYSSYPSLEAALKLSWASYDPNTAARRYWMVNEIFDQFVTNQFSRRRTVWHKIRSLEKRLKLDKKSIQSLNRAKSFLLTMPISEHQIATMQPSPMPGPGARYAPNTAEQKVFQQNWQRQADELLAQAENELRNIGQ